MEWRSKALIETDMARKKAMMFPDLHVYHQWKDVLVPNGKGKSFPMSQFVQDGIDDLLGTLRTSIKTVAW